MCAVEVAFKGQESKIIGLRNWEFRFTKTIKKYICASSLSPNLIICASWNLARLSRSKTRNFTGNLD
ncbi:hypothetical protein FDUTEX481_02339 [Tolypothrix sp. PCC 7601]|nr:hypothetical protein FDUTEX481_02339 [Tolypothrix sp. PCC 7601]